MWDHQLPIICNPCRSARHEFVMIEFVVFYQGIKTDAPVRHVLNNGNAWRGSFFLNTGSMEFSQIPSLTSSLAAT